MSGLQLNGVFTVEEFLSNPLEVLNILERVPIIYLRDNYTLKYIIDTTIELTTLESVTLVPIELLTATLTSTSLLMPLYILKDSKLYCRISSLNSSSSVIEEAPPVIEEVSISSGSLAV